MVYCLQIIFFNYVKKGLSNNAITLIDFLITLACFEITLSNMYKYIDMMKLLSLKEDHASQRSMIWILY